jgi:hypothetical protein
MHDLDPMLTSVHQIYHLSGVFSHMQLNTRSFDGVYITPLHSNLVYLRPVEMAKAQILD